MRSDETLAIRPASQALAWPRLSFVPLEACHVKHVLSLAPERLHKGDLDGEALASMVGGQAKALLLDGQPVACGGLIDERHGRALAWAQVGGAMPRRCWPAIVAEMRAGIDGALHPETGWAHRVAAETHYDWPEGHKLLLHLGMSLEGVSRGRFGPGKHGVTYARVRGDVAALPVRWRALLGTAARCLWEDTLNLPMPWMVDRRGAAA